MEKKQKYILLMIIAVIILCALIFLFSGYEFEPHINLIFRQAVTGCDKIIIRDGCYNPTETHYSNRALKVIDDPCDIRDLIHAIQFSYFQRKGACACAGWPAIDFYRNGKAFMIVSIKHNRALCMPTKDYDVRLTSKSRIFFEKVITGVEKVDLDPNK